MARAGAGGSRLLKFLGEADESTEIRLLRDMDEGIESVDRREGVGRGGGSINTPK